MDTGWLVFLEVLLVLGLVVGFAGWELWTLRRERRRNRSGERKHRSPPD